MIETEDFEMEYNAIEDRIAEIRHLKDAIEDDMPEDVTEENKRSALGSAWDKLEEIEFMLMGRLNELEEDYCAKYERCYSFSSLFRKDAELAKEAGVNFVAVWQLAPGSDRKKEVIEYLVANGKASLNYGKTMEAIQEYYRR